MAERKNSEAGPGRHSHAIPAPSFPTHNSPRTWFLTQALSPLAIRLIRLLLAHGDYVVACLPPHELADDDRSAEFRELANECRAGGPGGGGGGAGGSGPSASGHAASAASGGGGGSSGSRGHHKDRDREGWKDRIRGIRCDARLMGQCAAAVAEAVQVFGRIDILLCCQSEAVIGTVEELATRGTAGAASSGVGGGLGGGTLIRDQLETNFFSQVNLIKAALPQFRAQHTGHIMVLTSIGGHIGTPWLPMYTAATWALEGYCDSLAYEIAPFNIKVTVVQPNLEVQMLTNKVVLAPAMPEYSPTATAPVPEPAPSGGGANCGNSSSSENATIAVPSIRDVMTNVLNAHPDTALGPRPGQTALSARSSSSSSTAASSSAANSRYPKLSPAALDRLVLETVHALTAIGGHENPPARHIVGFDASAAVQDKLKTVSEELEDFVEASLAVDIFDSELKAEAREGRPAVAPAAPVTTSVE